MNRPSPADLKYWYAKAKKSGFRDIERPGAPWTFNSQRNTRNVTFVSMNALDGDVQERMDTSPFSHPTAVFWRTVYDKAREAADRGAPRAEFLLEVAATGYVVTAGRKYCLTKTQAQDTWDRFLAEIGLRSGQANRVPT